MIPASQAVLWFNNTLTDVHFYQNLTHMYIKFIILSITFGCCPMQGDELLFTLLLLCRICIVFLVFNRDVFLHENVQLVNEQFILNRYIQQYLVYPAKPYVDISVYLLEKQFNIVLLNLYIICTRDPAIFPRYNSLKTHHDYNSSQ